MINSTLTGKLAGVILLVLGYGLAAAQYIPSGIIQAITVDDANPEMVYASGAGYICKSTDVRRPEVATLLQRPAINLEHGAEQYARTVGHILRGREFLRRVTDSLHAWHEDHARRCDERHVLCIVTGATRHKPVAQAQVVG